MAINDNNKFLIVWYLLVLIVVDIVLDEY